MLEFRTNEFNLEVNIILQLDLIGYLHHGLQVLQDINIHDILVAFGFCKIAKYHCIVLGVTPVVRLAVMCLLIFYSIIVFFYLLFDGISTFSGNCCGPVKGPEELYNSGLC